MTALINLLQPLVDLTPGEVIGGRFLALMLAIPLGLDYVLGRRRWKDLATVLVAVAAALNSFRMVVTSGYATYLSSRTPGLVAESSPTQESQRRCNT